MKKFMFAVVVLVVGFLGYDTYRSYKGGFFDMPDLGANDFSLSYKNGFRGVMRNMTDERPDRKYLSYSASEVPPWFQETWSECRLPAADERTFFEGAVDIGPGGRMDAICEINADGDVFVRGWITSVPNL